ncbi:E3 ubiquitin-protein ligase RNF8-like [Aphis craccivora]|uniref:E3 ubiquitin-protein ligase RNF8-like n=1 Tax=Aphis craccivora TaxID=307492 RepID=A0A6G0Z9A9_APHCR|nr:E3 ubiquitin-protein ligase RNF8-like [Aphis craccivora]
MHIFFTMLEDIKNVMSSKRLNSDSNTPQAFVQDLKTGKLSEVKTDSNFLFGRAKQSSIVIEELYISRSHSTISYANGQFFLGDNVSNYKYLQFCTFIMYLTVPIYITVKKGLFIV